MKKLEKTITCECGNVLHIPDTNYMVALRVARKEVDRELRGGKDEH